ncbi:MAG: ATP-binding cassette domain-containing protein, partial [Spirochaeta sp.]|nr:ATP-binding cassette domain-containing protein [Spirochaeta sp.]
PLAKVLLENPDTLLLDEPTNYLDLEARNWLEGFLTDFRGSVLVVSHDRYFLDVTVDSVAELYSGSLTLYTGNYSEYETTVKKKLAEIEHSYSRQQEEIARLQSFIRRFRYQASRARQVQSRIKLLERMERIELPLVVKDVHFSFPEAPRSAKLVLELDGICKAYGNNDVFREVSLQLSAGQRLALVGINGAGKSTLMRLMAGVEKADSGLMRYGKNVSAGYFSQELTDKLDYKESVLETVESWSAVEDIPNLRRLLAAFLFRGDDIYKSVNILSGGEKSRLAILRLLLQPANLLFLDEPTNHLDMASKDILLSALEKYSGALIFVSHDRYFIDSLANRVLELNRGRAHYYYGDYRYYLWKKEGEQKDKIPERPGKRAAESDGKKGEAYTRRLKGKQIKSTVRKLTREEEDIMAGLEELQQEAARLEETMSNKEAYRDGRKMRELKQRLQENQRLQQGSLKRWEIIDSELKELKLLAGL